MKLNLTPILTASVILGGALGNGLSPITPTAQAEDSRFFCGTSKGYPATIAKTSKGNVPFIVWSGNYFSDSGWTPQRRCSDVSARFQQYYVSGFLKYLTTGTVNSLPVICPTTQKNAPCARDSKGNLLVLMTLRADDKNPGRTLEQLLQVRTRATGPLYQSTERPYFNIDEVIEERSAQGENFTPSTTEPSPNPSSSSSSSSGEGLW